VPVRVKKDKQIIKKSMLYKVWLTLFADKVTLFWSAPGPGIFNEGDTNPIDQLLK